MIPKIIHQIWIGDKKMPLDWMDTWRQKNGEYQIFVWGAEEIEKLGLVNRRIFDFFIGSKNYAGAADVARVEILEKFGGIYIDADIECLESLRGAPFLEKDFFAVRDHETAGHPGRINNAVIGSIPHHPILEDYVREIGRAEKITPPWCTIGGKMLTDIIDFHKTAGAPNVEILPAFTFWPENHNGQKTEVLGKVYGKHNWGTTKNKY